LAVLEAAAEGDQSGIENVYRGFLRVAQSILPTIAVVDGPAVGAGLNLALAANVRLASAGARFDSRFAALRLIPGGGHVWMLSQLVGPQVTALMTLFGQPLGADDAAKCGLVWRTYPDQVASRAAADDLARRLSELETPYVSAMNSLLRSTSETITHAHAVDQERYLQRWSTTRPAFLEGVTAMRSAVDRRRESTV
jgi:enoyl-CoA hydratase